MSRDILNVKSKDCIVFSSIHDVERIWHERSNVINGKIRPIGKKVEEKALIKFIRDL